MMQRIALFECMYHLRSIPSLVVACFVFGISFLFTANGVEFQSMARGNVLINAPYVICNVLIVISMLAALLAPSFMATAVLKDVDHRFDGILFATPITRRAYVFGRFLGAFIAFALTLSAAPLGLFLGCFWPWAAPETLGPVVASHYVILFIAVVLPTLFALSAVIFAVALTFRSSIYSYLAALALLLLYITVSASETLPAILDPFMGEVFADHTRYWTVMERNTMLPPYAGSMLSHRLLWLAIGLASLLFAALRFSPTTAPVRKEPRRKEVPESGMAALNYGRGRADWGKGAHFQQLLHCTKFEIAAVLKTRPFMFLMSISFLLLFFTLTDRGTLYNVNLQPITTIMLESIQAALTFALMIVLVFYSAEIIWRERSAKFDGIIDALPTPNWVFVVSKISALTFIMQAIVFMGILMAISLQIFSGFDDLQLNRYLQRGLIYYTTPYLFLAVLTCFFQVLARNRMLGILAFAAFITCISLSRDIFGVEHILLSYGLPGVAAPLSDMNGDSRFAIAGSWARLYWGSIAGVLAIATHLLWQRGTFQPLKRRIVQALRAKGYGLPLALLALVCLGSASVIYYNTNILNTYRTRNDTNEMRANYEEQYRQYQDLPMPRIIDVDIDVDIYPFKRRVEARATQILQNKTDEAIRTIHLVFPLDTQVPLVELEGAVVRSIDRDMGYHIYDLQTPMLPGDKRTLKFEIIMARRGFKQSSPDIRLVRNGTYLTNDQVTPYIGFYPGHMLEDANTRRKYGLPALPRFPKLEAPSTNNSQRHDSDMITFKTTVSTVAGQTAVAPGYLEKEWREGDRHYFTYKMDEPILNIYCYLSAEYQVVRDRWNGVDLEIYHHHSHDYNLDRMMAGMKDSLAYYSKAFGPYQYRQLRILEFPAYRTIAQSFQNTISFSESIGFTADLSEPGSIDLPYYVTAHEVAHQWWAHQVMSAHAQGDTMIMETLSQYSALLVMEQKYGQHQLRQFLKLELDTYLAGRAKDAEGELPLYKVEDQDHIHYHKGALVMVALKDYIGEETINRALRKLIANHRNGVGPYALSSDLLRYLKEEARPEDHRLIEDLFEKITLFDFNLVDSRVTPLPDGRFKVVLDVTATKYYQDEVGNPTKAVMDLPVDIGLFLKDPAADDFQDSDVIYLEKHPLTGSHSLELIVNQKPAFVGIDPYHKLIDRETGNNIAPVKLQTDKPGS